MRLVEPILKAYQEQQHLLVDKGMSLCPADQRIQVSPAQHQHTSARTSCAGCCVFDKRCLCESCMAAPTSRFSPLTSRPHTRTGSTTTSTTWT